MRCCLVAVVLLSACVAELAAQSFPFVIPGDDATPTVVDRSGLLPSSLSGDFVRVRDGHFFVDDKRLKFWGMNVCFGANFPTHVDADKLAPHLAKLGVNAVRFHHMDNQDAPGGIWGGVDERGQRQFSDDMVDRLDYFLAKLHEQGIYADLNLHVSRELGPDEGFPVAQGLPWWGAANKWVMYFDRDVQAEVKRYCRMLLSHRNPYRDNRKRTDDPGIALVEMLNENYFSVQGYDLHRRMPERFQRSLIARWNEWLVGKYKNQTAMIAAWQTAQPALGEVVIGREPWTDRFAPTNGASRWATNQPAAGLPMKFTDGPRPGSDVAAEGAELGDVQGAVRFEPALKTDHDYEQQLVFANLATQRDQPLTLTFWVRSDSARMFKAELSSSADGEWRDLDLFEEMPATPTWTRHQRVMFPAETLREDVRLAFSFGNSRTPIEFAGVTLREGAIANDLPKHQTLSDRTIGIPESDWPVASHQDMKRFMVDTELAWVSELKSYLRNDLGVKVPITASQVNYHHPVVHDRVNDFVDLHNYWHHPLLPSDAEWSPERWTVGNDPIEADPMRSSWPASSLLTRMGWRYEGKPMTLSEWNFPEPSPMGGGCVPMAAVLCGLQDWDGVFFFQYDQNGDDLFRNKADNFFSFNAAPVKLALFSQFGNVFTRGDLTPLSQSLIRPIDDPADGRLSFGYKIGVSKVGQRSITPSLPNETDLATPDGQVRWQSNPPATGHFELSTPASRGVWGTIAEQSFLVGGVSVDVGVIEPNYGTVFLSSSDGESIETASRTVLLVASHSENQDMRWNDDHTSVGANWGNGPTRVTTFDATIAVPGKPLLHCHALDGTGKRQREIPIKKSISGSIIRVGPADKTMWYELVR